MKARTVGSVGRELTFFVEQVFEFTPRVEVIIISVIDRP